MDPAGYPYEYPEYPRVSTQSTPCECRYFWPLNYLTLLVFTVQQNGPQKRLARMRARAHAHTRTHARARAHARVHAR